MTLSLAEQLRAARVYDLEQPRFFGMPVYPTHRPGAMTHQKQSMPPRSGAAAGST